MIETIRFVRRGSDLLEAGRVLSSIPIEAARQHGAALVIEPGLNVIAYMEPAERRLSLPQAIL